MEMEHEVLTSKPDTGATPSLPVPQNFSIFLKPWPKNLERNCYLPMGLIFTLIPHPISNYFQIIGEDQKKGLNVISILHPL